MRCSRSSAVAACALPEGSLGLDWMTPWDLVADKVGLQMRERIQGPESIEYCVEQAARASRACRQTQMYPGEGFRYGVGNPQW